VACFPFLICGILVAGMKKSWMAPLWFWLVAGLTIGASNQADGTGATGSRRRLRTVIPEIRNSRQLIVVTTRGWDTVEATVRLFTRSEGQPPGWTAIGKPFPAVIGAHGFGWGIGLHGTGEPEAPCKVEGDRRAPAGVFKLYSVFGLASPDRVRFLRFPYRQVTSTTEAVDDPRSKYYNRIVNREIVSRPDWSTSESMQRVGGRYRFGVMVEHNWGQLPGYGSCIFLHLWAGAGQGTAGCTAMGSSDLNRLLHWLDARQDPLVVQLPLPEYERLRASWGLPLLKENFPKGG
jgi:D-alanyl-D-alanine dipeptidase